MTDLNGTWIYQSFRPFDGPPSPVVPWSPLGKLSVATDATGKVDGKLTIPLPSGAPVPELVLTVTGSVRPAVSEPLPLPERIELTGKGGRESVYELRGYFVAGGVSPVIVGTVFAIQNDVAGQPTGTSGPFVLFPA